MFPDAATVLLLVNSPLSQQSLDIVLHLPDEGPLKAWKSQIIGASPYSSTMHSMVWQKIAGLRSLMAVTKVCFSGPTEGRPLSQSVYNKLARGRATISMNLSETIASMFPPANPTFLSGNDGLPALVPLRS